MIKYRTWYDDRIIMVEAVSETAKMVTIQETPNWERRTLKHPDKANEMHYHDSFQEAKDFLIDRENEAIGDLMVQVQKHRATRDNAREMIQP